MKSASRTTCNFFYLQRFCFILCAVSFQKLSVWILLPPNIRFYISHETPMTLGVKKCYQIKKKSLISSDAISSWRHTSLNIVNINTLSYTCRHILEKSRGSKVQKTFWGHWIVTKCKSLRFHWSLFKKKKAHSRQGQS